MYPTSNHFQSIIKYKRRFDDCHLNNNNKTSHSPVHTSLFNGLSTLKMQNLETRIKYFN